MLRSIVPLIASRAIVPGKITGARPQFVDVRPTDLWVDDSYQRDINLKGRNIIRKAVENWDWASFKPPIAVVTEDGKLHLTDGQHTAIAAATHPDIDTIPVQVVEAALVSDRARAFVQVNQDRIAVTPMELYNAQVTAGNEGALTIRQVCERAGVTIRTKPNKIKDYIVGETVSVSSVRLLVERRFAAGAGKVLRCLVEAGWKPITSASIKAVEFLMFEPDHGGVDPAGIVVVGQEYGCEALEEWAAEWAIKHHQPNWRGLAAVLAREIRRNGEA